MPKKIQPIRKFVRVELPKKIGVELRFFSICTDHNTQVFKGEKVLGAGSLVVLEPVGWKWLCKHSYTLNVDATPECEKMISATLGLERIKEDSK